VLVKVTGARLLLVAQVFAVNRLGRDDSSQKFGDRLGDVTAGMFEIVKRVDFILHGSDC
jgi:hypothetical protein